MGCGCLIVLLGSAFPRVALVLTWIFSKRVDIAFDGGVALPLLGLIFLPYTTLFYVFAYAPIVGVSSIGLVLRRARVPARPQLAVRRRPRGPPPLRQLTAARRQSSGGVSVAWRWSSSTTVASASVVVSPRLRPSATSRSRRRMILPLRVFGRSGVK